MARSSRKKRGGAQSSNLPANLNIDLSRAGMPAPDSIIGVKLAGPPEAMFEAVSTIKYRIIETNEVDEYEKAASSPEAFAAAITEAAPTGNNFKGTARKAAKISIAKAKTEKFKDLRDLIKSLAPDNDMRNHDPKIGTDAKSNRVEEEQRNVSVPAFIYAASREDDNDYHLIIGRNVKKTPQMYMTMELSGLPSSSSAAFKKLKAARDAFKNFFDENLGGNLPGTRYAFYDPPIPVEIEGSLFFDMSHAKGSAPGPKSLRDKMPTIWEVHPITKMVFEP